MNDNRMYLEKADQELSDDLHTCFMELWCQLSYEQKCAVVVSLILSAVANGCKGVNDDK